MADPADTCLPTTTWFLYTEEDVPVGTVYRKSLPEVGDRIDERQDHEAATVVSFTELRATCAMRRFKVVVRPLA